MIAEGIIAMIWAAAAMALFDGQIVKLLRKEQLQRRLVKFLMLLGSGGHDCHLGVIVLPITSGGTAFVV